MLAGPKKINSFYMFLYIFIRPQQQFLGVGVTRKGSLPPRGCGASDERLGRGEVGDRPADLATGGRQVPASIGTCSITVMVVYIFERVPMDRGRSMPPPPAAAQASEQ